MARKSEFLSAAQKFGFFRIGGVKELFHISAKDPFTSISNDDFGRKKKCINIAKMSCRQEADQFNVSRLYLHQAVITEKTVAAYLHL